MLFEQAVTELDLIRRHLIVLKVVAARGPIGIMKLSEATNMEVHKIRYSLRILEQKGLIKPTQQGAILGDNYENFSATMDQNFRELEALLLTVENEGKGINPNKRYCQNHDLGNFELSRYFFEFLLMLIFS